MKKQDLIRNLAKRSGIRQVDCKLVLDALVDEILDSLIRGDKVFIKNFATFEISQRPERVGRNLNTGEAEVYPPVKVVKCRMSQNFKDAINRK